MARRGYKRYLVSLAGTYWGNQVDTPIPPPFPATLTGNIGLLRWSRHSQVIINLVEIPTLKKPGEGMIHVFGLEFECLSIQEGVLSLLSRKGGGIIIIHFLFAENCIALEDPLWQRRTWIGCIVHLNSVLKQFAVQPVKNIPSSLFLSSISSQRDMSKEDSGKMSTKIG